MLSASLASLASDPLLFAWSVEPGNGGGGGGREGGEGWFH